MKKHDQVCSRASHPCAGYVVRAGADWVDVEWHAGIRCTYRERMRRGDVLLISTVLARAVDTANAANQERGNNG